DRCLAGRRRSIDDLWRRSIRQFLQRNHRGNRLRHGNTFLFELLLQRLERSSFLFGLQFFPEIRLPNSSAQSPFVLLCHAATRKIDHLANKMNRTQTSNQNQRGQINSDDKKKGAYRAESSGE